ncbi:DUF4214 domain-containing protein [Methylobacterium sp. WL120]|uniref:DUF4214 domain-containing protein n=1 Tax=Methylobacterium sp. WL120 TaxID=2603887 RepID=UPI0016506B60|nr:DUF4214 domain-containing protein [Methylobacterium sp. WL120]
MALTADQLNTIYNNVLFRNVDFSGIQFFANRSDISDAQVRQQIELSNEAQTLVSPIVRLYQEVLGRLPDAAGLKFFVNEFRSGFTIEQISNQFIQSSEFTSKTTATAGVVDATDLTNTNQLVTDAFQSILGRAPSTGEFAYFQGRPAAQILSQIAVSPEAQQLNAANVVTFLDSAALGTPNTGSLNSQTGTNTGTTFTLTTGVDSGAAFTGGAGNDTFNGVVGANATLTSLDSLNGGAGTDTLNITHTAGNGGLVIPNGVTVANIENVVLSNTLGQINVDASSFTGLQNITAQQLNTAGGVTLSTNANATSVNVTGGGTVQITDNGTGTTAGTKDVLATVSLTGGAGTANVASDALTTLNLTNESAGVTVNAAAGTRAIAVNVNGSTGGSITDATATSVTINSTNTTANATQGSTFTLNTDAATTVSFTGDKLATVTLADAGANNATVTSINASADTGGVTIASLLNNNTSFTGGQGADTVTVAATTKAIALGGGNDTAVVTGALGTGGTLDGGTGTNTISAAASVAATLSADTTFGAQISNFQQLAITNVGGQGTINLANLGNINYVKVDGVNAGGTLEQDSVALTNLVAGQSVTVDGRTVTASGGALSAAEVEQAFSSGIADNPAAPANATVNGSFTNFRDNDVTNNGTLVLTSNTAGNVPAPITSSNGATAPARPAITNVPGVVAPAAPTAATTQGNDGTVGPAQTEFSDVTFSNLVAGQSVTVAGLTATATGAVTAAQIENAFVNGIANNAPLTFSGALTGFTAGQNGNPTDGVVRFTSTTANFDVDNITTASNGTTEANTITFAALNAGQSVTVGDQTFTATAPTTANNVATYFANNVPAGYTVTDNNGVDTFTSTTPNSDVTPNLAVTTAGTAAPVAPTATETTAAVAGPGFNIINFTSGGTLELDGAVNGASSVSVNGADVSTTDVFNIKLNGVANIVDTAAITIANVETVNVSTSYTGTTAPAAASTLLINDTAATTITVSGNHGVNFTGSTLTNVTTLNASGETGTGAAGGVTFATSVTNKSVSLTGGAGDNVLSAASITDVTKVATITGAGGNDTITGGLGADTLSGGGGKNVFVYNNVQQSTIAHTDTITDFQANTFGNGTNGAAGTGATIGSTSLNGDVLDFRGLLAAGVTKVTTFVANNAADAQTFIQNTFQSGPADTAGVALDKSTGNLYVDVNHDGNIDSVIHLTGVTTITNAAIAVA